MAALSAIMPGLRDLRAPLAAGTLWSLVLLVTLSERVGRLGAPTGPTARAIWDNVTTVTSIEGFPRLGFLIFAVYLVGLISCSGSSAVDALLWIGFGGRQPSAAGGRWARWGARLASRTAGFDDTRLLDLVRRTMIDRFVHDQAFRTRIVEQGDVQVMLEFSAAGLMSRAERREILGPFVASERDGADRVAARSEENAVKLRRWKDWLLSQPPATDAARWWLLARLVDVESLLHDINREVQALPDILDLRGERAFDRWDRLRSEAEFRIALALPTAGFLIPAGLARASWYWFVLPTVLALLFGVLSLAKRQEADRLLISLYLTNEVAKSPVVDELRTGDPRWRR